MTSYVCTKNDWDWEVIDVMLVVADTQYNIKGFDEEEWQDAVQFAENFAASLNIEYVGDRTDT